MAQPEVFWPIDFDAARRTRRGRRHYQCSKPCGETEMLSRAVLLATLAVLSTPVSANATLTGTLDAPPAAEPNQPVGMKLVLSNDADAPAAATVDYSVQSDPGFYSAAPPDPVHGSDHAL